MVVRILVWVINCYQKFFSPDHSFWAKARYPFGYCRFVPSCSEYAKSAVSMHGALKGIIVATVRVLRCNPFTKPQYNPIIKSK